MRFTCVNFQLRFRFSVEKIGHVFESNVHHFYCHIKSIGCNISILGASGRVVIDNNGDRSSALQFKNIQNGRYHRVFNYFSVEQQLVLLNETVIIWPGNTKQAPLGRPYCGFLGEFCVKSVETDSKKCYYFHAA